MDDVPLNKIGDFESALLDHMNSSHESFMNELSESGSYNDEIEATIKSGVEAFKKTGTW